MDRSNLVAVDQNFVRDKFERDDPDFAIGGLGWRMDGCKSIRADVFGIVCGVCVDERASCQRCVSDAFEWIASDPIAVGTVIPNDGSEPGTVPGICSMDWCLRRDLGVDHRERLLHVDPLLVAIAENHRQAYGRKAARGLVLRSSCLGE